MGSTNQYTVLNDEYALVRYRSRTQVCELLSLLCGGNATRPSSGSRSLCIMRLPLLATFVVPVLSVCARVNTAQSNGWLDRDQVTKRFSLQLDVIGKWVPFTTVKLPGQAYGGEH